MCSRAGRNFCSLWSATLTASKKIFTSSEILSLEISYQSFQEIALSQLSQHATIKGKRMTIHKATFCLLYTSQKYD